ncbi:hypothetical protein A3Q56_01002 [Intoshia linei]|uniref:Uncharacterized protein n=1 Tax=Intoshia linei TaxID=1819745 RepID=A0A177BA76_9BILA|nr:hypothetical protein A3Q56_01002 [Intoshia linei]
MNYSFHKINNNGKKRNSKPSFIEIENESQLNQPVFQKELYEPVKSDESHETFETKNEYIDSEKIKSKPASNQQKITQKPTKPNNLYKISIKQSRNIISKNSVSRCCKPRTLGKSSKFKRD